MKVNLSRYVMSREETEAYPIISSIFLIVSRYLYWFIYYVVFDS